VKSFLSEPEIVLRNGKPVSVILSIKVYEKLMERVEAAEDVRWLNKARQRQMQFRPLEDYLLKRKPKRK
jgi:PHD/YefM family antitoxin component YafN of YafNO toxin-antitoxin module